MSSTDTDQVQKQQPSSNNKETLPSDWRDALAALKQSGDQSEIAERERIALLAIQSQEYIEAGKKLDHIVSETLQYYETSQGFWQRILDALADNSPDTLIQQVNAFKKMMPTTEHPEVVMQRIEAFDFLHDQMQARLAHLVAPSLQGNDKRHAEATITMVYHNAAWQFLADDLNQALSREQANLYALQQVARSVDAQLLSDEAKSYAPLSSVDPDVVRDQIAKNIALDPHNLAVATTLLTPNTQQSPPDQELSA